MKEHLTLKPYHLHEHVWLYEEMKGLIIVAETKSGKTVQLLLPIAKIRGYLKRRELPALKSKV